MFSVRLLKQRKKFAVYFSYIFSGGCIELKKTPLFSQKIQKQEWTIDDIDI